MSRRARLRRGRPPSISRSIHVGWSLPDPNAPGYNVRDIFDEPAMDKLLYAARDAGVISMHDSGRGAMVWFEGPPGPALRALVAKVMTMLPPGVVPLGEQDKEFERRRAARKLEMK